MAEQIAAALVGSGANGDIAFESAGTAAVDGEAASPHAIEVVRRHGGDLSRHRARLATESLLERVDLVLCMTTAHVEAVGSPHARLLSERAGMGAVDVDDPYLQGLPAYERTYASLELMIRSWLRAGGT